MTLNEQIFWGSIVLGICSLLQVLVVARGILAIQSMSRKFTETPRWWHTYAILCTAFAVAVFGHTLQIWVWAFALLNADGMEVLTSRQEAVYFSIVTYTSLGYGDVTLTSDHNIFGAFASVTGLLSFGLSTAFLVGLFTSLFQARNQGQGQGQGALDFLPEKPSDKP